MKIPAKIQFIAEKLEVFRLRESVVYFLMQESQVVYVGITENIGSRISAHKRDKVFDSVLFARVNEGHSARVIEGDLIRMLNPRYNKAIPPDRTHANLIHLVRAAVEKSLRPIEALAESLGHTNA